MTDSTALAHCISSGKLDRCFQSLYGQESLPWQKKRYLRLLHLLAQNVPTTAGTTFISAPGRTEIGGNHTDHNHGCIVAAAVDLDCVAAITPVHAPEIVLHSEQHDRPIKVDLTDLRPDENDYGTPEALVRGVAATLLPQGTPLLGFHGQLHATCIPGTGISSSAAFSVLTGAALNFLYLRNSLCPKDIAVAAQKAENTFFGKPSGLMDQLASAEGMIIFADFQKPDNPIVEKLDCSLDDSGYRLVIIDTGGSHTELTSEYASVPEEMQAAAHAAGGVVGRDVSLEQVISKLPAIRNLAGDRAALRLLHFIAENKRAKDMADHLRGNDFKAFLKEVRASGHSSCTMLQNCSTITTTKSQGILLALALSNLLCPEAVCRVHGGGFAGTVQAYVPTDLFLSYKQGMENVFGSGKVYPIRIGRPGVCGITANGLILPDEA